MYNFERSNDSLLIWPVRNTLFELVVLGIAADRKGSGDASLTAAALEMEQQQKQLEDVNKLNQKNAAANAAAATADAQQTAATPNSAEPGHHGRVSVCSAIFVPPNISSERCFSFLSGA